MNDARFEALKVLSASVERLEGQYRALVAWASLDETTEERDREAWRRLARGILHAMATEITKLRCCAQLMGVVMANEQEESQETETAKTTKTA